MNTIIVVVLVEDDHDPSVLHEELLQVLLQVLLLQVQHHNFLCSFPNHSPCRLQHNNNDEPLPRAVCRPPHTKQPIKTRIPS